MIARVFGCAIEPKIGRYGCYQISKDFEYIKLSFGEMESFIVMIESIPEGIYKLRLGMKYRIGDEIKTFEVDDDILEIGIYDPVFHTPSCDFEKRIVEGITAVKAAERVKPTAIAQQQSLFGDE